jgi:hypothetical protein
LQKKEDRNFCMRRFRTSTIYNSEGLYHLADSSWRIYTNKHIL